MSGFHYIEFSKTGSILLNAEEKDELFSYIDRLKAESAELRELLVDLRDAMWGGGEWTEPFDERMRELGIEVE